MKVLIVSAEVVPFSKTGGLADVAGILPLALKGATECDVRVVSPFYKMVKEGAFNIRKLKDVRNVSTFGCDDSFELLEGESDGVKFYFIGEDGYYGRDFIYGTPQGGYPDNALRFSFLCRAALAAMDEIGFYPDIIHTNDWEGALIPFYKNNYLKEGHPLRGSKVLFAIHNLGYQGLFTKKETSDIGLTDEAVSSLEYHGKISIIKSGILYSDAISTVSKKYAREILTPEYGCGLERILLGRKKDLYGILNGVDYANWDPETDKLIPANYGVNRLENKMVCKKELLKSMKMDIPAEAPLIGSVGRLAQQKGVDLIVASVQDMIDAGAGFVLLGSGEEVYEEALREIAKDKKSKVGINITFDNKLAHMIEAGCDIFIMPSRYEPCGLNQMYSLRYGTIPVVRATGGLDDTIIDYSQDHERGNGFKFTEPKADELVKTIKRAIEVFHNKKELVKLQKRGMNADFSWQNSAREYADLYKKMMR